jgi:hypothetical protein
LKLLELLALQETVGNVRRYKGPECSQGMIEENREENREENYIMAA